MQYYHIKDIEEIIGCTYDKAAEIIRKLNNLYEKEYPDYIFVQGRIPKWFYDEKMGTNKEGMYKKSANEGQIHIAQNN